MKEQCTDSVQNRFTAYLVTAITNQRIRYMDQRKRVRDYETISEDTLEKKYIDFELQYHEYLGEKTTFIMEDWRRFRDFIDMMESEKLADVIGQLKEREKTLLFARALGELSFKELGEELGLKPKQAEMAYFYVLRKIRKKLEAKKDEL